MEKDNISKHSNKIHEEMKQNWQNNLPSLKKDAPAPYSNTERLARLKKK